jgi:hypothetical protein
MSFLLKTKIVSVKTFKKGNENNPHVKNKATSNNPPQPADNNTLAGTIY